MPGGLAAFRRTLRAMGYGELYVAEAMFLVVTPLTIVQVFLRYFLDTSIWWASEISQLLILIAYFFGIAYVFKARQYIIIEFIVIKFSRKTQVYFYYIAQILTLVVAGVVLVMGLSLAPRQMVFATYILGIPKFYSALPLLIGSASMILTTVYYCWAVRHALTALGPDASLDEIEKEVLLLEGPW